MRIRLPWPPLPNIPTRNLFRGLIRLNKHCRFCNLLDHPGHQYGKRHFCKGAVYRRSDGEGSSPQRFGPRQQAVNSKAKDNSSNRSALEQIEKFSKLKSLGEDIPERWIRRLEQFLPTRLRLHEASETDTQPSDIVALLDILRESRPQLKEYFGQPLDLLTYMVVRHRRHNAVLHFIDQLIQFAATGNVTKAQDVLPSNIQWATPYMTMLSEDCGPVSVNAVKRSLSSLGSMEQRYQTIHSPQLEKAALAHVWHFLGAMVVRAANGDAEEAHALLTIAHRALAAVHHLNLVPDNVYSYSPIYFSSTMQRPPILHLLSSRILTTLSDAVWRSTQDEAISEAASLGVPYRKIGQDPPGGRFRLKVRDLGPEAWLEFILWCCVEGGFESTGANIIELIRSQTDKPWFAVSWTGSASAQSHAVIDWDRVKLRSGGTVGSIEGYSNDEPLVNIPPRTISVEVVLALIESFLNARNMRRAEQKYSVFSVGKRLCHLISFLEPHSLPVDYFDYLTVRMLQIEALDFATPPELLHSWSRAISWMRSLESTQTRPPPTVDLRYQSIIDHSELQAGLAHQVLQAYLLAGYPNEAVDVFNQIQQLVDSSKIQAISSFISSPLTSSTGFFDARPVKRGPDFVDSHGQLPLHKVAAFLNMVSENNLMGLGEWMLYSEDVDGPVIPRRSFVHPSMATALTRYAGESNDSSILNLVVSDSRKWRMRPTVKYLRSIVNACVRTLDISGARKYLWDLVQAEAGGYSPDNLAYLAGALFRLESRPLNSRSAAVVEKMSEVELLMRNILDGQFNGRAGSFYRSQITLFRQQVGHLLRIFDNIPSASLNEIAFTYMPLYPTGNAANLAPDTFNIILDAVVATQGAAEGRKMWEMFCKSPKAASEIDQPPDSQDYFIPLSDVPYEDDSDYAVTLLLNEDSLGASDDPVELPQILAENGNSGPAEDDLNKPIPTSDISFEANLPPTPDDSQDASSEDTSKRTNPLVVPSIKTLRIIARGAIFQQLERRLNQGKDETESVIRWTGQHFRAFGRSRAAIRRELQTPISEIYEDGALEQESAERNTDFPAREREMIDVRRNFTPGTLTRMPWRTVKKGPSNGRVNAPMPSTDRAPPRQSG